MELSLVLVVLREAGLQVLLGGDGLDVAELVFEALVEALLLKVDVVELLEVLQRVFELVRVLREENVALVALGHRLATMLARAQLAARRLRLLFGLVLRLGLLLLLFIVGVI